MDIGQGIVEGFTVALSPSNLIYVTVGVVLGMIIGVLPGLGPAPTIALLLPLTYVLPASGAVIMLAGIYYGAYYGGTVTSVLLRLPGEAASVVTVIDGHQMSLQGRAGPALGISAIGSFIGGLLAVVGLMLAAPWMAQAALSFGPPEYVVLAALGLLLIASLGSTSLLKGLIAGCLGLLVATIGIDSVSGAARFTFGSVQMLGGIDFIAVVMGSFGLAEILYNLGDDQKRTGKIGKVGGIWPTKADRRQSWGSIGRGSVLGFFLGVLPGGGGFLASIASYGLEKRISKTPERFGRGAIQGVAGPESANNAGATSSFIPLLTLGLPSNVVLALLYGALLIQGITPGPQLVDQHPEIFWGVIASMVIGNLILLMLSMPFIGMFVQLVRVRMGILSAGIIAVIFAGVYSINNSFFDLWVMVFFGIFGYFMRRGGWDPAPLVLALILGPIIEVAFRQSMLISGGSLSIFVTRPITLAVIIGAIVAILFAVVTKRRAAALRHREAAAGVSAVR